MKAIKYIILALGASVFALSCNKETIKEEPSQKKEVRTFYCDIAETDPDSKATIVVDGSKGKVVWEAGDKILIHGRYTSQDVVVTLKSTDLINGGKTAQFSVALPATGYDPDGYYAAYPADAYVDYDGEHGYYYNSFNKTNNFLMAGYLNGDRFKLFNLCGVISFKVAAPGGTSFDQYYFEGNNGEVVGYEKYQVKLNSGDTNYYRTETGDGESKASHGPLTTIAGPVTSDGTTINYIYLPNGANFTTGFTIKFLKEGAIVKQVSTQSAVNVARNKYLALGDISSHLKEPVVATDHTTLTGGLKFSTATDLTSGKGPANCYIVSTPGQYKFPLVKGNSSSSVGAVNSAVIVWESYNNAESVTANSVIEAVDYYISGDTKYLVFKTPETLKPGNALLAVKDISNDILWSWHIWIPKTTVNTIEYSAIMTPQMMDRNLGALEAAVAGETAQAPTTFGLMYQWGRKDPFLGPRAAGTSSPCTVAGASYTRASGHIDSNTAIKNPTMFGKGTNADLDGDWISTSNADLWGGESNTKTINDPCPYGYKVPKQADGKIFNDDNGLAEYTGFGYDKIHYWFKVGDFVSPLASYYDYDGYISGSGAGTRAIIWSASAHYNPATKGDYAYGHYVYWESDTYHSVNWSQRKARAASVRCVKE